MTTLAVEKPRGIGTESNTIPESFDMIANDKIFHGAAVGESASTGTVRPLVAGDTFVGFADETVDNTGGLVSAKKIKVRQQGVALLPIASIAIANIGDTVYASDDDTFTLSSTGNSAIGKVVAVEASGIARVFFQGVYVRSL